MRTRYLVFPLVCAAILVAATSWEKKMSAGESLDTSFPKLSDYQHDIGEPPYIVNIFASWCTPCVAELPQLREWKETSGIRLIGIAWRDKPEKLRQWIEDHQPAFDAVIDDQEGKLGAKLGIKGLPMTYLVDANGDITLTHEGIVTQAELPELIKKAQSLK